MTPSGEQKNTDTPKEKRRTPTLIGAAIVAVVICTAALVFYILLGAGADPDTPAVILPSPVASDSPPATPDGSISNSLKAEVTPATVQEVIATLTRADSYTRTVTFERFSGSSQRSYTITTWVRGPSTRISIAEENFTREILVANDELWIWYSDSPSYYHGSAEEGHSEADEYQKMLSYEDVLALDPINITDAGYVDYGGEACIYVKYISGEMRYASTAYISISTGLLMGSEAYDGNSLIFRMVSDEPDISTPADEAFTPPV